MFSIVHSASRITGRFVPSGSATTASAAIGA